jgi:hypothetical protein
VLDDQMHKDARESMENDLITLKERYKNFNSIQYDSWGGPVVWYNFHAAFFVLWSAYHQSFSFRDESVEFRKTANLYLEGLIISYATKKGDKYKLQMLPDDFVKVFITYGYWIDLRKLLSEYKLTTLVLQHSTDDVIKDFARWLESGYHKTVVFDERIEKEILFDSIVQQSRYLERRSIRTINNFLLLLEHLELNAEQVNSTVNKLINYLSVSTLFGVHDSHGNMLKFIVKNVALLTHETIRQIATYSLSDHIWPGSIIHPFGAALATRNDLTDFFDEKFYTKMIQRADDRREWPLRTKELLPYYLFLKQPQKTEYEKVYQKIVTSKHGDTTTRLVEAQKLGMLNPRDHAEIFNPYFSQRLINIEKFPKYIISKNGHPLGDNYLPWNAMYFTARMIYIYDLFDQDFAKEIVAKIELPIFKWILQPEVFDYAKFKTHWLLTFNRPEFLVKLKTIPAFMKGLNESLKKDFDPEVAKIYYQLV